jgi:hypothetical protein
LQGGEEVRKKGEKWRQREKKNGNKNGINTEKKSQ